MWNDWCKRNVNLHLLHWLSVNRWRDCFAIISLKLSSFVAFWSVVSLFQDKQCAVTQKFGRLENTKTNYYCTLANEVQQLPSSNGASLFLSNADNHYYWRGKKVVTLTEASCCTGWDITYLIWGIVNNIPFHFFFLNYNEANFFFPKKSLEKTMSRRCIAAARSWRDVRGELSLSFEPSLDNVVSVKANATIQWLRAHKLFPSRTGVYNLANCRR